MIVQGKLTISRVSSNKADDCIQIRLAYARASITFAKATVSLVGFASAITGLGFVLCEIEVRGLDLIGKQREHKTEEIFIPGKSYDRKARGAIARKAIEPFEVDGWRGDDDDANNSHRWVRREPPKGKEGQWTMISFERWVDVVAEETK